MEIGTARRLIAQALATGRGPLRITREARRLADLDHDGHLSGPELRQALASDELALDPKLRALVPTATSMALDPTVVPGWGANGSPEECYPYAARVFQTELAKAGRTGENFATEFSVENDLAEDVRGMAFRGDRPYTVARDLAHLYLVPGEKDGPYHGFLNGGITPPRAGDLVTGESADGKDWHVAIVAQVAPRGEGGFDVTVHQANVPLRVDPAQANPVMTFPMHVVDGRWTMDPLPTTHLGYPEDMAVVGWLHPTGDRALPGAAAPAPADLEAVPGDVARAAALAPDPGAPGPGAPDGRALSRKVQALRGRLADATAEYQKAAGAVRDQAGGAPYDPSWANLAVQSALDAHGRLLTDLRSLLGSPGSGAPVDLPAGADAKAVRRAERQARLQGQLDAVDHLVSGAEAVRPAVERDALGHSPESLGTLDPSYHFRAVFDAWGGLVAQADRALGVAVPPLALPPVSATKPAAPPA